VNRVVTAIGARHWVVGCLAAMCVINAAAAPAALEVAASSEHLSGARSDWRSAEILAIWDEPAEWSAFAALRRTERFDQTDDQVEGGASWRLTPGWRAEVELAGSDTHRVLPQWRVRGRGWWLNVGGWNLAAGLGRTLYRSGIVQGSSVAELQAEQYFDAFRFVWIGSITHLDVGGSSGAQQWHLNWYPNDTTTLGLLLAFGRELENVPGTGVVAARVQGVALSGVWKLSPDWRLSAELSSQKVGDFYERTGLRLGLRRQF